MSATTPFLGKWQLAFTPLAGGNQQVFTWQSGWGGHPNIAAFAVYQQGQEVNSLAPTVWILPDFKDPSDWNGWMTPWLTREGGLDTFGMQLFFNDKEDSPSPSPLNTVLSNPPALPPAANPTPNQYAPGPLSLYDVYGDGTWYNFGWAQFSGA